MFATTTSYSIRKNLQRLHWKSLLPLNRQHHRLHSSRSSIAESTALTISHRNTKPPILHRVANESRRSIHFLPLIGMLGGKMAVYTACSNYGWSRVYRRLLEQNRLLYAKSNPEMQARTQQMIRLALEAPAKLANQLTLQWDVVKPFLESLATRAPPKVPSFLVWWADTIMRSELPARMIKDLLEMTVKMAMKKRF